MPTKTTSKPKTAPGSERLSMAGLMAVMVLINGWFLSQALTYFH
jgi:hypothetical protein